MKSFAYPGNIEADILSIGAEQIPYMRTEWFSGMMLECQSLLLELLDCPGGGVIPYTASGTAAMESCVRSFAATRKKALVVNGGTFGARWAELCGYSGIPRDVFDVDFGKAPCWERLIQAIASGDYGTLLIQHHETSSGYLYDLSRLSDACRDHDVALVVDAISSFLTDPLSMRDLHIDILVLSSQKGLNLPPGLSFVVLSDRVLAKNSFAPGGYYYDWGRTGKPARSQVRRQRRISRSLRRRGLGLAGHVRLNPAPHLARTMNAAPFGAPKGGPSPRRAARRAPPTSDNMAGVAVMITAMLGMTA